jgi:hypothetical protein
VARPERGGVGGLQRGSAGEPPLQEAQRRVRAALVEPADQAEREEGRAAPGLGPAELRGGRLGADSRERQGGERRGVDLPRV